VAIRAVVLFSGSLANLLAARIAEKAGVTELSYVFFRSPFFEGEERVLYGAAKLGISLRCVTLKRAFLRLPEVDGQLFPCGPCRRILLARAARLLRVKKFDLVITGEVVGKGGLGKEELLSLDEELGLRGRVLRPLSAQLLPPTWAEEAGLIRRDLLGDLSADDLEPRLQRLAKEMGISAKGNGRHCLLNDPLFARRFQAFGKEGVLTVNFLRLLEFPNVVRLGPGRILVVALTPAEKVRLGDLFLPEDVRLYVPLPGSPLGLLRAPWAKIPPEEREKLVREAAAHLLALAGFPPERPCTVCFRPEEAEETARLSVLPGVLRGLAL